MEHQCTFLLLSRIIVFLFSVEHCNIYSYHMNMGTDPKL